MDAESAKAQSAPLCSAKPLVKFCLTYFTTFLILALIVTAINSDPMSKSQMAWKWGFVVSLIISGSLSGTALLILIYTDFYRHNTTGQDIEENIDLLKVPLNADNSQSASFKTVMTINSMPNTTDMSKKQYNFTLAQLDEMRLAGANTQPVSENFLNLTPSGAKSPVTVVDMHAMNAKRKADKLIPSTVQQLDFRPDNNIKEAITTEGKGKESDDMKSKKKKHKKHKKKKPADT